MSSVDDICKVLVASQILTSPAAGEQIGRWRSSGATETSAASFVSWLVQQGVLTEFQGEALLIGQAESFMFGPYRVSEQIFESRSGGIFRAEHVEFHQPVSLKIFPRELAQDAGLLARIGREMRIAIELDHPHIVRSFQVGTLEDTCYLALEDLRGETLAAKLDREVRLPYQEACRLIRDVAQGLEHLHQRGVIHRDIRPANIWMDASGRPKLMEFGAAIDALTYLDHLDENDEATAWDETVIGKYDYTSPEQAYDQNCADALSDLYALGSTLYHCLTGRPPFVHRDPVKQVLKHVYDTPVSPSELIPQIPHQVDDTVQGMLAKNANQRFQTAGDVVFALSQYVDEADEAEAVVVVEVSSQYLQWARSSHPGTQKHFSEQAVGVTPELTSFLDFLAARHARRRAKKKT